MKEKMSKVDVFVFEMLTKAKELVERFEKDGMSEDDIINVLTEAFCDDREVAIDWYHAAKDNDLINSFK